MNLTDVESDSIKEKINTVNFYGKKPLSISESYETPLSIQEINDLSSNTYEDRINFYKFESPEAIDNWHEMGDLFYKTNGLVKTNFENA